LHNSDHAKTKLLASLTQIHMHTHKDIGIIIGELSAYVTYLSLRKRCFFFIPIYFYSTYDVLFSVSFFTSHASLILLPPEPASLWQLKYLAATGFPRLYWRAKVLVVKFCRSIGANTVALTSCSKSTKTMRCIPVDGRGLS
jgi:hypothetical protein